MEFGDRLAKLIRPAENLDDVADLPVRRNRRNLEHIRQYKLGRAVLGIFFEQLVEDLPRFRAVLLEEIFACLAELLRPLAAGAERGVEGEMTEQVERVRVGLLRGVGEFGEVDPALLQAADDLESLLRVGPLGAQLGRGRTKGADAVRGKSAEVPAPNVRLRRK